MTAIQLEDIVFPAIISILAAYQLGNFARAVGKQRAKHKIKPPATTGEPSFERALRAQQNTVEFMPMFLSALWVDALFFNPVISFVIGLVYLYARHQYFASYVEDAEKRMPPFKLCVKMLQILLVQSCLGITQCLLLKYAGFNLKETVFSVLPFKPPV
ncbi:microsomal glutathione S-transferase 2-like [Ptychodera flava]|uniref:microsomal glutathione S-transferase 2-like n=1 Tax=Ptychodera flava TaxID=63121 RepID=UPI00396A067C